MTAAAAAAAAAAEDEYCRRERLVLQHVPAFLPAHPHHHQHQHPLQHQPPPQPPPQPQPPQAARALQAASPAATAAAGPGDPYMRRDLGYHHHYRLPPPSPAGAGFCHPHAHHGHGHGPGRPYYPAAVGQHRSLPAAPPALRYHHPHHQHHGHHHHQHHALAQPSPSHRHHGRCCPPPQPAPPASPAGSCGSSSGSAGPPAVAAAASGAPPPPAQFSSSPLALRGRAPSRSGATPVPSSAGGAVPVAVAVPPPAPAPAAGTPVEYVGASGGRVVSTPTPPPVSLPTPSMPPRCAAALGVGVVEAAAAPPPGPGHDPGPSASVALCCGAARRYDSRPESRQSIVTPSHHPALWRAVVPAAGLQGAPQPPPPAPPPQQQQPQPSGAAQPPPPAAAASAAPNTPLAGAAPASSISTTQPTGCDAQPPPLATPAALSRRSATPLSSVASTSGSASASSCAPVPAAPPLPATSSSSSSSSASASGVSAAGDASVTAAASGRLEPPLSRTEIVKQFIKRETAVFFGVEESVEEEQRLRWLERRKRLAARKWGQLRPEFAAHSLSAYASPQGSSRGAPDVLPAGRAEGAVVPRWAEPPGRRKQSVATMTYRGLAYVISTLTKHRRRPPSRSRQHMRSYSLPAVAADERPPPQFADEVFFDKPQPAGSTASQPPNATDYADAGVVSSSEPLGEGGFVSSSRDQLDHRQPHFHEHYTTRDRAPSWRRTPERLECITESGPEVGCSRIWSRVLDRVFDNSDRRQYGMSVLGRFFGQSTRQSFGSKPEFKEELEDIEDHRPFFTYWVTTVQVLILIISIACYGLGPVGIDLNHRSGQVLVTSLSLQQVDYQEPANFWIGPRAADLIHLGAKFAPCMRKDAKIIKEIEKGREKERETACCIRNDDSGCVQSSQADCSVRGLRPTTTSTWKKWSAGDAGPGGRISGSVCGLDPKFCEAPASIAPYEWPDDITKWPICRKTNSFPQRFRYKDKMAEHMVCEVIGHPCCIGIHGTCRITTKEYCDFVRGYFHEEASLCSQVSCLDNVCGMIPFYAPEVPDQFYRLWTSLFLHAGILHLAITLVIQYFLMRDLEKLTGPLRIAIIYLGSGMAGNLASAIFVPYRAEVGPAGAQFGLLACLIVEVLNVWQMLRHPDHALLKLLCITLVLFVFGLLPWVDNYAHLFGFIFGFLLSYALLPFVSFGEYDRHKKVALIWVCLLSAAFLFAALIVLFYIVPVYDCEVCTYFNCLPITRDFCSSQNINFKREEPVV